MIRIKVITPIVTENLRDIEDLRRLQSPTLRIDHTLIDQGPSSIESAFDEALCVPGVLAAALLAQSEGCDAVVIDCFGDPGLQAARELLEIPVFGPGESSMHAAAMLGQRFSIVTVLESVRPMLTESAHRYGVSGKLASIRVVDVPVLSLHNDANSLQQALFEQSRQAVLHDGADAIVLGCTGFLGCAESVKAQLAAQGLDVPVVDPIPMAIHMAQAVCQTGLRHSKRGWPRPTRKPILGFAALQAALDSRHDDQR
jgi:allantoin racemase